MNTKVCGRCGIDKPVSEFPLRKKINENTGAVYVWYRLQCYECMREIGKYRYNKNRENIIKINREYEEKNKEKVAANREVWRKKNWDRIKKERAVKYQLNAEEVKKKRKEYYYTNKERCINSVTEYVKNNKHKVLAQRKKLHHKKSQEDIQYLLKRRLRGRVRAALKNRATKAAGTMKLIGCSIEFLASHLESLFIDGMGWDNMNMWHIDHKLPCAAFDLTEKEEQLKCFHWSNLQPLWGVDNLKKGAKF